MCSMCLCVAKNKNGFLEMNRGSRFCFLEKQIYGLLVVATAFFALAFSAFAAIVLAAFSP